MKYMARGATHIEFVGYVSSHPVYHTNAFFWLGTACCL